MLKSITSRSRRTWLAVVVASAAVTFSGGTAAFASAPPPDGGGGAINCEPMTDIYADGNTIHFNGWTRCANPLGYELQIGYNEVGGVTKTSNIKTCRGPLAGDSNANQISCGIAGISGTMTDNKKDQQRWCVNTFLTTGGPGGKKQTSLAGCIKH